MHGAMRAPRWSHGSEYRLVCPHLHQKHHHRHASPCRPGDSGFRTLTLVIASVLLAAGVLAETPPAADIVITAPGQASLFAGITDALRVIISSNATHSVGNVSLPDLRHVSGSIVVFSERGGIVDGVDLPGLLSADTLHIYAASPGSIVASVSISQLGTIAEVTVGGTISHRGHVGSVRLTTDGVSSLLVTRQLEISGMLGSTIDSVIIGEVACGVYIYIYIYIFYMCVCVCVRVRMCVCVGGWVVASILWAAIARLMFLLMQIS